MRKKKLSKGNVGVRSLNQRINTQEIKIAKQNNALSREVAKCIYELMQEFDCHSVAVEYLSVAKSSAVGQGKAATGHSTKWPYRKVQQSIKNMSPIRGCDIN